MARRLVASAPARANLIGNPSDQYGGNTLACTLALRARVVLADDAPGLVAGGGVEARIDGAADLALRGDPLDLARAVLSGLGLPRPPFSLRFSSEIPRQSGLAGSTALVVAMLGGALAWLGQELGPHALAERARRVELAGLGVQCGFVDQYACVFGGLRFVDLRGKAHDRGEGGAPFASAEDLTPFVPRLPFQLAYTGVRHSSDAVHRPIRERWLAGEPAVLAAYERIAELGALGKRALLEADWPRLGAWMNENHAIQRELGGSGDANERLIAAALAAGAPGAKLAGAGDGGSIVALWPDPDPAPLERALREAGAAALYRPAPSAGLLVDAEA